MFGVSRFVAPEPEIYSPPKQRLWLHLLLLVLTLFTTTLVGAHMQYNFSHNLPFFDIEQLSTVFTVGLQSPARFLAGLPFSLTLLTILMAHELGHYLACVYYGVDATLPYFLPSPTPVTGTFGAFIRIRSAIRSKRILFDIGVGVPFGFAGSASRYHADEAHAFLHHAASHQAVVGKRPRLFRFRPIQIPGRLRLLA